MISLRIRSPSGTSTIKLDSSLVPLASLREQIFNVTGIAAYKQELRIGFPPQLIDQLTINSTRVEELGIKNGEMINVSESVSPPSSSPSITPRSISTPPPAPKSLAPASVAAPVESKPNPILGSKTVAKEGDDTFVEVDGGYLVLRVIPDDNSCLFTAVAVLLEQTRKDPVVYLRNLVASTILSDSDNFSDAVLGRSRDNYVSTIRSPNAWGGAIELSIFSTHYKTEICSIDVQSGRIDRFGSEEKFDNRIIVVYSGIHYDAITFSYASPSSNPQQFITTPTIKGLEFDTTIFSTSSDQILNAALKLVTKLREKHSYTDAANFTLKCEICSTNIVGEKEAQAHAKSTGHTKFGEYQ